MIFQGGKLSGMKLRNSVGRREINGNGRHLSGPGAYEWPELGVKFTSGDQRWARPACRGSRPLRGNSNGLLCSSFEWFIKSAASSGRVELVSTGQCIMSQRSL